jgi:hypothetical protein
MYLLAGVVLVFGGALRLPTTFPPADRRGWILL